MPLHLETINRSGSIADAGTAQLLMPARQERLGFSIRNTSVADLWVSEMGTASAGAPSMRLAPGALYHTPSHLKPCSEVWVCGEAAGQTFTAVEW